jgi:hypothetical protein
LHSGVEKSILIGMSKKRALNVVQITQLKTVKQSMGNSSFFVKTAGPNLYESTNQENDRGVCLTNMSLVNKP